MPEPCAQSAVYLSIYIACALRSSSLAGRFVSPLLVLVTMSTTFARLSDTAKAQAYGLRFPTKKKTKALSYPKIAAIVKKTDGTHPSPESVREAVVNFTNDVPLSRKLFFPFFRDWGGAPLLQDARAVKHALTAALRVAASPSVCHFRNICIGQLLVAVRAGGQRRRQKTKSS